MPFSKIMFMQSNDFALQCFEMTSEDSEHFDDYIWKSTTVIAGIYLFFLTERFLQSIMDKRHVRILTLSNSTRQPDILVLWYDSLSC